MRKPPGSSRSCVEATAWTIKLKGGTVAACSRVGSCAFVCVVLWCGMDPITWKASLYTFSQTRVCNKCGTILVFETVVLFLIIENFGMQSCCITKCRAGRRRGTDLENSTYGLSHGHSVHWGQV